MSLLTSIDLDPKRVTRYAHPRSWLMDSHPPYRYHIDNADVSSILGVCWESPWSIWEQMRSQQLTAPRVQRSNQLLKWTPILRRLFEAQTARSCDLEWRRIQHAELEWARTSLFSISFDPNESTYGGVLFFISSQPDLFAEDGTIISPWEQSLCPANIAMEGYWALLCSGLPFIDITVAFPSQHSFIDVRVLRLYADLDVQKGIEHAAKVWRDHHLIQGEPPTLDGSRECSSYLMEKYRHGGHKIRRASKSEEELLKEYNALGEELKQLQEKQRKLRNQLFAQVGPDKGFQTPNGSKAIVSRSVKGFQLRTFIKPTIKTAKT